MAQSEGAVSYGRGCGGLECPVHLVGRGGPGEVRPHSACPLLGPSHLSGHRLLRRCSHLRGNANGPQSAASVESPKMAATATARCSIPAVRIIGGRGRRAAGAAGLAAPRAGCPVAPSSRSVRGGRRRGSRRTRSRRPYMLDGTVPWLSSDLRVFQTGAAPPAACGPAGLSPPHALATKSANPFRPTVHDRHFVRRGASKRFLK